MCGYMLFFFYCVVYFVLLGYRVNAAACTLTQTVNSNGTSFSASEEILTKVSAFDGTVVKGDT